MVMLKALYLTTKCILILDIDYLLTISLKTAYLSGPAKGNVKIRSTHCFFFSKRGSMMASLRAVACYFALFALSIFYIKKQAFCSSNLLYDTEQSQGLQETFIYSSLWSYRRLIKWNWASNITNFANSAPSSPVRRYRNLPWSERQMWLVPKRFEEKPKQDVLLAMSFEVSPEMLLLR